MQKRILMTVILLLPVMLMAQEFGGNPPSLKWKQINTDTARIIFPAGLDSQALRVASLVHQMAAHPASVQPVSLGNQLKKINIILQNQTTIANGYVGLGPFRSEFFLTPDLNSLGQGSIAWTDQLAIHEYRHVQQYNNFNHGISHLASVLFGQEGYALATNAAIPDWFFEGDAVYNETVLSKQGRGRLPQFLNTYPALWQAGKNYSWMKLRNGSYKDYVPNHYYLGYLLVNYGRLTYGPDFWTKVTRDASAYRGVFYPFQKAIRRYAGVDYKTFREQAFAFYRKLTPRVSETRDQYLEPVNKRYVTSYYFPYRIGLDSLLYLKADFRHRAAFMLKDANGEHRLRIRDISTDEQFSYRNGKIVYAAYESDPRWSWRDYSVLQIIDVASGKQQQLTHRSKYFTPDISADGSKVAAVEIGTNGKSELHIIDATNGKVVQRIHANDISLFTDPKFIDEENLVTAVRLSDGKMALALAEIKTGNTFRLTPPSFNVIGYPCVSKGVIYFTASYQGNDDVFALRRSDNRIARVTNGPLGNYFVNAANGMLTWSTFTAEGYQLQEMAEADIVGKEIAVADQEKLNDRFPVSLAPGVGDILLQPSAPRTFAVKDYKKFTGLFNFHSWRPYYEDPVFTFSLYGENVLNTLQTEVYYLYNQNEKTSAVGASAVYGGWFPYLQAGTEYTFDRQDVIGNKIRHWDQLDSRVGLSIPLNWAKGTTLRSFSAGTNYVLRNEFNKGFYKDSVGNSSLSYLLHTISWGQQVQRAVQHIFPRLGYSVNASYRHVISRLEGQQFNGSAVLYLPGLLSNHHFVVTGAFQQRDTLRQVAFANNFSYSRGYTGLNFSRMWRVSGNYHFPVFYPDFGLANILYLQRVRANLFYDFTKVYSRNKKTTRDQRSAGMELYVDTRWWNQYPLTFGIRVSRLLDRDQYDGFKGTIFEFVLPVSILPK